MRDLFVRLFSKADFMMKLEDDGFRTLRANENASHIAGSDYARFMCM